MKEKTNQFDVPILFIVFNRPDTTRAVFEAIRKIRPKQLFIAADGPRNEKVGEKELCDKTRKIATAVDWNCEVKTLFREENLGCGKAVSGAINWFFENVEEGIILEDDCLPNQSFFPYCQDMLEQYRLDENIFMISGDNFLPKNLRIAESYYLTRMTHIWGWATWRRAWKKYDFQMSDYPFFIKEKEISKIWSDKKAQSYWLEKFNEVRKGDLDTWDYQWTYCIWKNQGFSITPNINLISNIGFGDKATHTLNEEDPCANLPVEELKFPITKISLIEHVSGDNYENKQLYTNNHKIKSVLKKVGLFKIARKLYLLINQK